jgi:hypothetical protein
MDKVGAISLILATLCLVGVLVMQYLEMVEYGML